MAGTPRDYNAIAPNFSSVKDQIDMYGGGGGGSDTPAKDIDWYNIFGCYEFDEESSYEVGDRVYVIWNDEEPRCYEYKTSHAPGPFSKLECNLMDPILDLITEILAMIAPEFSTDTNYSKGDLVVKDGLLYEFTVSHSATDGWIGTDVIQKDLSDVLSGIRERMENYNTRALSVLHMVAPIFMPNVNYSIGDLVRYNPDDFYNWKLYKFTSAHTAGTSWDSSEVTETTLAEVIAAI